MAKKKEDITLEELTPSEIRLNKLREIAEKVRENEERQAQINQALDTLKRLL